MFNNIPHIEPLKPEDMQDFAKKLTDNFHPATVTANTTQVVVIIIIICAVILICYYCRHRFTCCGCCAPTPTGRPPVSEPIRLTGQHWFPPNDNEPDTISQIADANRTPPIQSRLHAFRQPFQALYSSFPAWNRTAQEESHMTSDQMRRDQHRRLERRGPIRRNTESESNNSSIIRTTSFSYPNPQIVNAEIQGATPMTAQEFEEMKYEQQRLIDSNLQARTRSPEQHVSFDPRGPSTSQQRP